MGGGGVNLLSLFEITRTATGETSPVMNLLPSLAATAAVVPPPAKQSICFRICYLSHLLLSIFKMNLNMKGLEISLDDAIEELGSMYNVYFFDKKKKLKFSRTVALSKIQEKILKSINSKILKTGIVSTWTS